MARESSEAGTNAEGGLLGPLKRGELSEQLERLAFSLPVGEVSEIIEAPYGFHICVVESRTESRVPPLDEIGENLRRWLEDRKYLDQRNAFMAKLAVGGEVVRQARVRRPAAPGSLQPALRQPVIRDRIGGARATHMLYFFYWG